MSNVKWISVINHVPWSIRPAVCLVHGRNLDNGHYAQIFQPNPFMSAMLTDAIDLNQFLSLSVTWTLVGEKHFD